jgi:hypothetical protein
MQSCWQLGRCAVLGVFVAIAGCGSDECGVDGSNTHNPVSAEGGMLRVEIGTPGGDDGLDFIPLEPGGDIKLETFGQGGTHATVAVRAYDMGTNRAFLDVSVENALTGKTVSTIPRRVPELWTCDDARHICDMLPLHVMTPRLTEDPADKDGLVVRVTAVVRVEDGPSGEGSQEGVLRKAFAGEIPGTVHQDGGMDDDAGGGS